MTLSVLIVVTHLLGVGHLTRAAAIGRGLARAGHRVTLVTGGRAAPLVSFEGLHAVALPSVHCEGVDFRTLLGADGTPATTALLAARRERLIAAFDAAEPDVVVTETYPFGRRALAAEFRALLERAAAASRPPAVLASVRDILNPPSRPDKADAAAIVFGRFYDGVLVHGDGALAPLAASWPTSPDIERRLIYTGYIAEAPQGDGTPRRPGETADGDILVSGGGSAASLPLFRAALGAATLLPRHRWRLLVGHGVPAATFELLAAGAGPNVGLERARPDFPALLRAAAVSVSQAGYNTVVDLAQAGPRAVLVPFEAGREAEQRLRAERFAALGLARVVPEEALSPQTLARAVQAALVGEAPRLDRLAVDGLARTAAAVERHAAARLARLDGWDRLGATLDGIAAAGRTVGLWWRDDDAIAPTPALDRLLDLARRHRWPLALAVVPAHARTDLAERLAAEIDIVALVHGWAHANHASPGEKKRELGGRSPDIVFAELVRGLARIRDLFGDRARPVLVPPWNRIDDDLLPHLEGLGFAALSTYGPASGKTGLAILNTHCDPVDWRGGGGLADEAAVLDGLSATLSRVAARFDPAAKPIGLLTHHLVHDERIWRFLERLLAMLAAHEAVRVLAPDAALKASKALAGIASSP